MVFKINHIHHLLNKSKMLNFAHSSNRSVYISVILLGNILDQEMENLNESNPISFTTLMSSYKIIEVYV